MLIVKKEAEKDIKSAYDWYEEQRTNLGRAFVAEVDTKLQQIEGHPEFYSAVVSDVRRALCKKFPYSIYFVHREENVIIIAVLHQRRNPAVWQARQKAERGA